MTQDNTREATTTGTKRNEKALALAAINASPLLQSLLYDLNLLPEQLDKQLRIAQVDLDMRREHQAKDVWYWQGDGEDHVESMGNRMLVAIYASDLRAALAAQGTQKAEAWKSAHDDARDAILNGRGPLEAVLDGYQTNAVLDAFDDAFSPLYATPTEGQGHPGSTTTPSRR